MLPCGSPLKLRVSAKWRMTRSGNNIITIPKWMGGSGPNTARQLSGRRRAAIENLLKDMGLRNPNQIQVQEGGTFMTKKISLQVIE